MNSRSLKIIGIIFLCILSLSVQNAISQTIDTLVNLGNYSLHFKIIKGKGTPILFESGGGLNAKQWDTITTSLYKLTGTTLITYDREGFGKSSIDTANYTILHEINGLEQALTKLGYGHKPIMIVCHSLGGFYSRVYASRHQTSVKGIVMFDPRIPSHEDMIFAKNVFNNIDQKKLRQQNLSLYFVLKNMESNSAFVLQTKLKSKLPILDIMAEAGPFDSAADNERFKTDQRIFVKQDIIRSLIFLKGSSHNIPLNMPQTAVALILSFYEKYK